MPKLREIFNKAKFARCRARFAVPVILYEGKVRHLINLKPSIHGL